MLLVPLRVLLRDAACAAVGGGEGLCVGAEGVGLVGGLGDMAEVAGVGLEEAVWFLKGGVEGGVGRDGLGELPVVGCGWRGVSRDRGGRGEGKEVRWAPGVMLILMWMGRGWERRRRRLLTLEDLALFVCQV